MRSLHTVEGLGVLVFLFIGVHSGIRNTVLPASGPDFDCHPCMNEKGGNGHQYDVAKCAVNLHPVVSGQAAERKRTLYFNAPFSS